MVILGIETSCDETSAAIIETQLDNPFVKLVSNIFPSSMLLHAKTGGIIPEIAAREQIKYILPVIKQAFNEGGIDTVTPNIDAIAVTYGPGLIGSLLVGVETAKTLALAWNKPIIPVNHLFGHIYANWIESDSAKSMTNDQKRNSIPFPVLALIVSGGHTDLVLMKNHKETLWLGGTRDDAAGECFDKCARLLGYSYPGGPKIAEFAAKGTPSTFQFPRPMLDKPGYDFSFSGLKTSFMNTTRQYFPTLRINPGLKVGWQQIVLEKQLSPKEKQILYDLCASLQKAIIDVLIKKTLTAAKQYSVRSIVISGGVSANQTLRDMFIQTITKQSLPLQFFAPAKSLCTDNAAMIATAGYFNHEAVPWWKITANPQLYFD